MLNIWPGWLAGSAIGALMVVLYWSTNKQLGVSQAYGYACQALPGADIFRTNEFRRSNRWRLWFVIGIPLGGVLANAGNPFSFSAEMGELYGHVLPRDPIAKSLVLLAAGTLMGLGARMAGGCTSGHVISGISQLNPASMVAGSFFFIGGIAAVQMLFLWAGV